jgi:hypothetical protein
MTDEDAIEAHLALAQYHAQRACDAAHSIMRRHHGNLAELLIEAARSIVHETSTTKRLSDIVIEGGKA